MTIKKHMSFNEKLCSSIVFEEKLIISTVVFWKSSALANEMMHLMLVMYLMLVMDLMLVAYS
jgi:hypothetical protein